MPRQCSRNPYERGLTKTWSVMVGTWFYRPSDWFGLDRPLSPNAEVKILQFQVFRGPLYARKRPLGWYHAEGPLVTRSGRRHIDSRYHLGKGMSFHMLGSKLCDDWWTRRFQIWVPRCDHPRETWQRLLLASWSHLYWMLGRIFFKKYGRIKRLSRSA